MPPNSDSPTSGGLIPPATPISSSPHAAAIRAAYMVGQPLEIGMLPVKAREVRDQRALEACVSCASAAAMEIRDELAPTLSAMSHYRTARVDRRFGNNKGRLSVKEGLATLEGNGIASHVLHPALMTDEGFATPLSPMARADAKKRRLTPRASGLLPGYQILTGGSRAMDIREALKAKLPVLMGFVVPRTYPDTFLGPGHIWDDASVPLSPDGHCVVVIGFDDFKQALCIQDSRGQHPKFDNVHRGCWWMGYTVADSDAVVIAASLVSLP